MTFAGPIEFAPHEVVMLLVALLGLLVAALGSAGVLAWAAAGGGRPAFLLGAALWAPVAWLTWGTGSGLVYGWAAAVAAGLAVRVLRHGRA